LNQTTVIIPLKSRDKKSRLAGALSAGQRREFSKLMLADVLRVLRRAGLKSALAVSSDKEMLAEAARLGARVVREPKDSGVNSAVLLAARRSGTSGDLLVLPSDLALLRGPDLARALSLRAAGVDIVIAPSRAFNGTNALLFSASLPIPLSYDSDSFWNHLRAASRLGLTVGVCTAGGLMFDVDTPADLLALSRSRLPRGSVRFARRALR
jgi:2-phospho-L-lactate/phosphoenolpyruvate guanylyltransferase